MELVLWWLADELVKSPIDIDVVYLQCIWMPFMYLLNLYSILIIVFNQLLTVVGCN